MSKMQSLETLNLSHNSLSGSIPTSFAMLGLLYVDMSYNDLHGSVPNITAFRDASKQGAFDGNKGLCGDFGGLKPCNNSTVSNDRRKKIVVLLITVPLVASLLLIFALIGSTFLLERKRKDPNNHETKEAMVYSILNHDGRAVYEEIIRAINNFDPTYCIGVGGYGSIYKANFAIPNMSTVAVKKLQRPPCEEGQNGKRLPKEFLNEIRALLEIRHRNIVKLYGFCSHERHSFLVYEYAERGILATTLREEERAKEVGWKKRVNIVIGVACALAYLHHDCSPPIVHRDISSKNILLDSEFEARVSDFGTAKLLNPDSTNWTAIAGTFGYVAPGKTMHLL